MARSVEDAALLYNAMQGPDPKDAMTRGIAFADPLPTMKRGVAGLKLAIMPASARDGVDPEVLAAFDASVETLRGLGARAEEIALPLPFAAMAEMAGDIIGAEGYHFVGDLVDDLSLPIDEDVRPRIWRGREMTVAGLSRHAEKARGRETRFCRRAGRLRRVVDTDDGDTRRRRSRRIDQSTSPALFTRTVNILDRCALAIPNGFTAGGLPTSLHIVCDGYDEAMALRIGWAYEQATDWRARRPPV